MVALYSAEYVMAAHICTLTDSVPGFVGCVLWIGLQFIVHVFALRFRCVSRMLVASGRACGFSRLRDP